MVDQDLMNLYFALVESIEKRDFSHARKAALKLASYAQKLVSPESTRQEYLDAKESLRFGIFLCAMGSSKIEKTMAPGLVRDALTIAVALGGVTDDDILSEA